MTMDGGARGATRLMLCLLWIGRGEGGNGLLLHLCGIKLTRKVVEAKLDASSSKVRSSTRMSF
jgi:hypothetical protein